MAKTTNKNLQVVRPMGYKDTNLVSDGKFCGVANSRNKEIIPCKYTGIDFQVAYYITQRNEKFGVRDLHGNKILSCKYDGCKYLQNSIFKVEVSPGKFKLYSEKHGFLSDRTKFDQISNSYNPTTHLLMGKKGDKYYLFDKNGHCVYKKLSLNELNAINSHITKTGKRPLTKKSATKTTKTTGAGVQA